MRLESYLEFEFFSLTIETGPTLECRQALGFILPTPLYIFCISGCKDVLAIFLYV